MKKIFTLIAAFMMLGALNANAGQETTIKTVDYTSNPVLIDGQAYESEGYPFWNMGAPEGASFEVKDGALVIVNPAEQANFYDLQPFIIDWFTMKADYTYKIAVFIKSDVAGKANLSVGTWSAQDNVELEFDASTKFVRYIATIDKATVDAEGSCHVLFQCGKVAGTMAISKVEIYEIEPETPPAPKNWYTIFEADGTFTDLFAVKYFKNYVAATSEGGAIVVESLDPDKTYTEYYMEDGDGNAVDAKLANDWDTQFLITLPFVVPKNTNMKFSMKYWADKAAKANTQVHSAPEVGLVESKGHGEYPEYVGTYVHYALMGDVNFPEAEDTFEAEFKVPADGMQAICFNLECLREVNKYYFDDIKVQIELTEDDYTTGVIPVSVKKVQKGVRYNLAGQKVDENYKGLVIENGKKFFNK